MAFAREESAILSQLVLNESEDILNRKELESDIETDVTKSADEKAEAEEAVTLTEMNGKNSDFSFMIYDNINEKFDQLEKSFENKSDSIVESIEESEALDNELPSTIHKDTLDISKQNTPETESPPIGKEEETEAEETGEVEADITAVKFSAKIETENTKEEQSLSVLLFWLLFTSFTVFFNLYVKYLLLKLN